jgi:hypothetical protein
MKAIGITYKSISVLVLSRNKKKMPIVMMIMTTICYRGGMTSEPLSLHKLRKRREGKEKN